MRYKVVYSLGPTIDVKTKVSTGVLSLADGYLVIEGKFPVSVRLDTIRAVELFRLHGLGTMIKAVHDNGTLFLSVPRFTLFGLFLLINYFKTKELHEALVGAIEARSRA
jgi:hypothetical protein